MKTSNRSIRLFGLALLAGLGTAAVTGCTPPPPPPQPAPPTAPFGLVPETARRVAVGIPPLSFATSSTGPVYVIDETSMSLVTTFSPPTSAGGIIYVDPTIKAVTLQDPAGNTAKITLASPIDPAHKFSIWASPTRPSSTMP